MIWLLITKCKELAAATSFCNLSSFVAAYQVSVTGVWPLQGHPGAALFVGSDSHGLSFEPLLALIDMTDQMRDPGPSPLRRERAKIHPAQGEAPGLGKGLQREGHPGSHQWLGAWAPW